MRINPYWFFGIISFGTAIAVALLLALFIHPLAAWVVAINVVTVCVYRYDKSVAGSQRTRVPERVLLLLHAVGGAIGASIAMWIMRPRHKTRSAGFLFWFFSLLIAQGIAVWWFYFRS